MEFASTEKTPRLAEFDLDVPEELIAMYPSKERDRCRMMVLDRSDKSISHHSFPELSIYLHSGDVLVLNDTKVFPARLYARKEGTDAKVEIFLLRELEHGMWETMVKPARKVRIGNRLTFDGGVHGEVMDNTVSGGRVIRFDHEYESFYNFLDKFGKSPLPPYIKRAPVEADLEDYQTVFAKKRGAVAAPTAGLHFTIKMIHDLKEAGIIPVYLTLHVGLGTFKPVKSEDVTRHTMDSEYFAISQETADTINEASANGNRIVAVGTTVARALESSVLSDTINTLLAGSGWTDKFIYPPYEFRMVDALITNFHQPKSTLIMLVSAFAGKDYLFKSYLEAIAEKYHFYSYGDAMLIH